MAIPKPSKSCDDTPAEFSFLWRRSVAIAWLVVNSGGVGWIIWILGSGAAEVHRSLMWIAIALLASNCLMAVLYYAGASAVDLGVIFQGLAKLKQRNSYDSYYDRDYGSPSEPEPTPSKPDGE